MKKNKWIASDGVIVNNLAYMVCMNYAILFIIDMVKHALISIERIPGERIFTEGGAIRVISNGEMIIIIPFNFKYIHIFNIKNGNWDSVGFNGNNDNMNMYSEAIINNNNLYMIGALKKDVLKLDLRTRNVEVVALPFQNSLCYDSYYSRGGVIGNDDLICFALSYDSLILKYDVKNTEYEILRIDNFQPGFSGMVDVGTEIWLSPRMGVDMSIWDKKKKSLEKISIPVEMENANGYLFAGMCYYENEIFIRGQDGVRTFIISLERRIKGFIDRPLSFLRYNPNEEFIWGQTLGGDIYYRRNGMDTYVGLKTDFDIESELMKMIRKDIGDGVFIGVEKDSFGISDYIKECMIK